jgi:hypothetical protein
VHGERLVEEGIEESEGDFSCVMRVLFKVAHRPNERGKSTLTNARIFL